MRTTFVLLTIALFAAGISCDSVTAPPAQKEPVAREFAPGAKASVKGVERVPNIIEGNSNIRTDADKEFVKVVFALSGSSAKAEFSRAQIKFVEADGKEKGPVADWTFADPAGTTVWVYSMPRPVGTKFKAVRLNGVELPLEP
jgi:hypothetical protein